PICKQSEKHLCIRSCAKRDAFPPHFFSQLTIIVDLPVVDNDVATIGRLHRLGCTLVQVDNCKSAMSKCDTLIDPSPLTVWSTGPQLLKRGAKYAHWVRFV